ncbi:spore germination protein [Tumebacillus flagellatus]|uniref:Membrane protein n=1 Tax=Tumebacillus flagellatus TaxID=1157490 RepID=A0A074LW64_9BACL|nr:spore germination protein [Tumebacillus flagellatus]KEO84830.1 membrane protein [Tumebacillus flagellatus]
MKKRIKPQPLRPEPPDVSPPSSLSLHLQENVKELQETLADVHNVVFRSFLIAKRKEAALIYLEGLTDVRALHDSVLKPLMTPSDPSLPDLVKESLPVASVREIRSLEECARSILDGNPILLQDQVEFALRMGLEHVEQRGIEEPKSEPAVRGSQEGFTESLPTNLSIMRRIIRSPHLKSQMIELGSYTNTQVVLLSITGVADPQLVQEVHDRVSRIETDGILEGGYLEEFIEDTPYSPFPQVQNTQRPDVVAAALLEGRVALVVEGTPDVLILPTTLNALLQASDDYYQRFLFVSSIRLLRYFVLIISLVLPGVFVAMLNFHQEMIPTRLLISIASAHEVVPFPSIVETFMMQIAYEILREAGLRLPRQAGSAVTIVGALVIGEAAVSAGFVSAPVVIVIALTGIASFTTPHYALEQTIRLIRLGLLLLGGMIGMLGIMFGLLGICIHLCALRSFGVPYLFPITPLRTSELKDTFVRVPHWKMDKRPHFTGAYNKYRQKPDQKPNPSKD